MAEQEQEQGHAIGRLQGSLEQVSHQLTQMHRDTKDWQSEHADSDQRAFTKLESLISEKADRISDDIRQDMREQHESFRRDLREQAAVVSDHGRRLDEYEGTAKFVKFLLVPLAILTSILPWLSSLLRIH